MGPNRRVRSRTSIISAMGTSVGDWVRMFTVPRSAICGVLHRRIKNVHTRGEHLIHGNVARPQIASAGRHARRPAAIAVAARLGHAYYTFGRQYHRDDRAFADTALQADLAA